MYSLWLHIKCTYLSINIILIAIFICSLSLYVLLASVASWYIFPPELNSSTAAIKNQMCEMKCVIPAAHYVLLLCPHG